MPRKFIITNSGVSPLNNLNVFADVAVVDADTGEPIIDPVTSRPAAFSITDNDLDVTLPAKLAEIDAALEIRLGLVAARDKAFSALHAIRQAGGEVIPAKAPPVDPGQAEAQKLVHELMIRRATSKPDDPDLLALQDQVDTLRKQHPEYFGLEAKADAISVAK